jgi:hypothetical protein
MNKQKSNKLMHGDLVTHKNRGDGIFESYAFNHESCFVKFNDTSESDKVTTSMVKLRE